MRTCAKNKRKLYYATLTGVEPVYVLDENGNKIVAYTDDTTTPPTVYYKNEGYDKKVYSAPVEFLGNIAMSGGESEAIEFGINKADYSAVLVTAKGLTEITETSLVWFETEPVVVEGVTDAASADYTVAKIIDGYDYSTSRILLNKVVKNE